MDEVFGTDRVVGLEHGKVVRDQERGVYGT